jgi:transglutaminase-like putative cysteine protease
MSTRRRTLADSLALTAAAAATTWLAFSSWRGFTEDPGAFTWPLLLLAVLIAGIGAGLRHLRWPPALVVLVQLVVGGVAAGSLVAGTFVVSGEGWLRMGSKISAALETAQDYPAPVPSSAPGIEALLILGGLVCLVVVDLCVGGLRRVSLAGLPLLMIYSIPISTVLDGVAWWSFAATAAGFMLLLFLQHREQTMRWGRGLGADGAPGAVSISNTALRTSASALAGSALVLAVLVPQFVPTLSLSVFGFGPGNGSGGSVIVENPIADLRRDLLRGEDRPVFRFTTDDPAPSYLRLASLTVFNDNEWSTGARELPPENRAEGPVPTDEIDPEVERERREYDVSAALDFESDYLPLAYPVDRVEAIGDWRYELETLDFMAWTDGLSTEGLTYSFTEVELDIDDDLLRDAPSWTGKVSRDYIELPDEFPQGVDALAQDVTRDYPSRYEKAVALQQWFRVRGGFTYSLERADPGNGVDELEAFLQEGEGGRVGYCEQFASAMAVMARSLGIPARVAVGFLAPTELGNGEWEFSTDDYHAWPELYFSGAGWVRFEPTPSNRPGSAVPSYTQGGVVAPPPDETSTAPTDETSATNPIGERPTLDPGDEVPGGDQGAGGRGIWDELLVTFAILVLLVVVLLAPRLVRRCRSRERLTGAIEPAWIDLRATAIDLGVPWPDARSPQETRDQVVRFLGAPSRGEGLERPARGAQVAPEAVESLDRLVLTLELLRYARPPGASDDIVGDGPVDPQVVTDTETVQAALFHGATLRAQRRATWLPASVLPWRRRGAELPRLTSTSQQSGVVDHVG